MRRRMFVSMNTRSHGANRMICRHTRITTLCCAIASLMLLPNISASQDVVPVRVKVEASPGVPIPSALVSLVDAKGHSVAEGLSSVSGRILMSAPRGAYSIRVRRIGYKPFVIDKVTLPTSDEVVVRVESERIVLTAMRVGASARCGKINSDAEALAQIWEEVEKGLRSSELNARDISPMTDIHVYSRQIVGKVTTYSLDTTIARTAGMKPFATPDAANIARLGYVRNNPDGGWTFFGPDENVLLSNEFAATHCFRIVRDSLKRAGQVGVAFRPVPGRRVSDIEGVMWLNEETAQLQDVRFTFVNTGVLTRWESGGFTRFDRLPSGAVIVDEWQLRMPTVAPVRTGLELVGYAEKGGVALNSSSKVRGVLAGQVYDSVSGNYLAGTTVSFRNAMVISDSAGRFAFTDLSYGEGAIRYSHPSFGDLGIEAMELPVKIYADTTNLTLTTPSALGTWNRLCKSTVDSSTLRTKGIVHGFVTDAAGEVVPSVRVTFRWTENGISDGIPSFRTVTSDASGQYAACGIPLSAEGSITASVGTSSYGGREFSFGTSTVARRDLLLPRLDVTANPNGIELVVAVTDPSGAPVTDALVYVENSNTTSRTNDQGRASLSVSDKEATINVRRMGYAAQTLTIRLGDAKRQQLKVAMSPAQLLPTVSVVDRAPLPAALERRRQSGRGTFYGPEEVAAAHGIRSLIGHAPGVSIDGVGLWAVRLRHPNPFYGSCWADFYLDGISTDPGGTSFGSLGAGAKKTAFLEALGPSDIYAVEIYPLASQAPAEFVGVRDGCGVVMVWTKSYAERNLAREAKPMNKSDSASR